MERPDAPGLLKCSTSFKFEYELISMFSNFTELIEFGGTVERKKNKSLALARDPMGLIRSSHLTLTYCKPLKCNSDPIKQCWRADSALKLST